MRPNSFIASHVAALESVAFQSTMFFKELTAICEDLKKTKEKDLYDSELLSRLSQVIKHHTNFTITVELNEQGPAIDVPSVDRNNPLATMLMREYMSSSDGLKLIDNAKGVCHGTVNILSGKVGGLFAEIKNTLYLPPVMFTTNMFTGEEIAAAMLHELGHLFTYYEFITRSVTTNQVLAGVAKALDGSDSFEQREAVLVRAKKALEIKELDAAALAKSRNGKVVEVVMVTQIIKEARSELGSDIYDMNSWEALSDQYATRMGAGRALVTALDKMHRAAMDISFRSTPMFLYWEAIKIFQVGLGIAAMAAGGAMIPVGLLLIAVGAVNMAVDADPVIYNTPGARFKRVRDQIVTNLKDKKLKPADRLRLEADLEMIDKISKEVNDRRQLIGVIWDFLSPAARKERSQMLLQQELEALAANDLFVKAGQLKQLA